jgi:hypothetical protein
MIYIGDNRVSNRSVRFSRNFLEMQQIEARPMTGTRMADWWCNIILTFCAHQEMGFEAIGRPSPQKIWRIVGLKLSRFMRYFQYIDMILRRGLLAT